MFLWVVKLHPRALLRRLLHNTSLTKIDAARRQASRLPRISMLGDSCHQGPISTLFLKMLTLSILYHNASVMLMFGSNWTKASTVFDLQLASHRIIYGTVRTYLPPSIGPLQAFTPLPRVDPSPRLFLQAPGLAESSMGGKLCVTFCDVR
jgi:hypothetical protein